MAGGGRREKGPRNPRGMKANSPSPPTCTTETIKRQNKPQATTEKEPGTRGNEQRARQRNLKATGVATGQGVTGQERGR